MLGLMPPKQQSTIVKVSTIESLKGKLLLISNNEREVKVGKIGDKQQSSLSN